MLKELRHPLVWLKGQLRKVVEIRDSPHAIALGIAIGLFWGFVPLYGLKTILSLVSAIGFRANKISAVVAVSLHDLLFPVAPFLFGLEFYIGEQILKANGFPVDPNQYHHMHLKQMLNWTTFLNVGEPLMIGSFVVGMLVAPIVYLIARPIVQAAQNAASSKAFPDEKS